ncbi:hypothetical protein [Wolbachia endosymbiont of Cimex lectularius]|uniref:hypothetical protein n=1 Tax=Wolbachia endosymbiont of Cimex lectularius TaxID=246273 RepID=UPI00049B111D|nr:hypothetical protein [Wolbachia endosymbiont of Cimex lectularius]BAO99644.1 putative uncharacterized protein [Wolbachia endosymbiont of Cimex lectularius]
MAYSDDDIQELYQKIATIIRYDNKGTASLKDLLKKSKWEEVNFQDKCEGGHSLGNLLLKYAAENNNSRVKNFFLNNGFTLPGQEQVAEATNEEEEEEEQKIPDIAENKVETSSEDSSNSRDAQFTTSYDKIKEIVTQNPNITAEEFYEKLKKEVKASTDKERDTKIFDSFADAVRSGASITDNRSVFLKIAELFTDLDTVIHLKSLAFKTILDIAVESEQADVVEILLESGKFNEEEKLQALNSAIVQGNIQGAQSFLGHIEYEKTLGVLNTLKTTVLHREKIEGMRQFFSYNKNLTKEEKAQTLIDAVMSYNVSEVKRLLEYMVGIPETSMEVF